jgi:hypothetical protein
MAVAYWFRAAVSFARPLTSTNRLQVLHGGVHALVRLVCHLAVVIDVLARGFDSRLDFLLLCLNLRFVAGGHHLVDTVCHLASGLADLGSYLCTWSPGQAGAERCAANSRHDLTQTIPERSFLLLVSEIA